MLFVCSSVSPGRKWRGREEGAMGSDLVVAMLAGCGREVLRCEEGRTLVSLLLLLLSACRP